MANPSKRESATRKVVSAARAIVACQIGLSVGCQRLQRALDRLSPYESDLPATFDEYMKAVAGLPLGTERLHWDRASLREKDAIIGSVNRRFHDQIMETCWALMDRFGQS